MAYDAILILGGGVREGGELPPWAAARFDLALELATNEPFVCLSAATTHRPPPLENGFPIAESVAGARYLMGKGIHPARILIENASLDTIGNAYLSKLIHVDPPGWTRLLVITSEFHMPRTRAIFKWVYGLDSRFYEMTFTASPNVGITPEGVRFREKKEAEGLSALREHTDRIGSLPHFHRWFFTEHGAYSAQGRWRQEQSKDPRVLESY
jgi:hypothetical protein